MDDLQSSTQPEPTALKRARPFRSSQSTLSTVSNVSQRQIRARPSKVPPSLKQSTAVSNRQPQPAKKSRTLYREVQTELVKLDNNKIIIEGIQMYLKGVYLNCHVKQCNARGKVQGGKYYMTIGTNHTCSRP